MDGNKGNCVLSILLISVTKKVNYCVAFCSFHTWVFFKPSNLTIALTQCFSIYGFHLKVKYFERL